ncbi:hypothetical protein [Fibrella arboris]|uniref:hypothetical protein n=1 Tax=Fibrella arboris TaxID=3242486 RepID=UPI003521E97E
MQDKDITTSRAYSIGLGLIMSALCCWLIVGCQSGADRATTRSDGIQAGTYLLTSVQPLDSQPTLDILSDSTLMSYVRSLAYSLYLFAPDGRCHRIRQGTLEQGRYVQTALTFGLETYDRIILGKQSLTLVVSRQVGQAKVPLTYKLYRLNLGTDQLRFTALAENVFTHPVRSESDEKLRDRVKNSLYFYSLFFRTIYTNQFNRFKPAAISLPIRYYSGGIRVPVKFDSTASWTALFASVDDARKAHSLYKEAAKKVKRYPAGESMIHEYGLVLADMANAL